MDHDAVPNLGGQLTTALLFLAAALKEQEARTAASLSAAREWERRAVLGTATLANELGLRVREAEYRERRLHEQLADLAAKDPPPDDLRRSLVRLLSETDHE
jgi:hypothetical protein